MSGEGDPMTDRELAGCPFCGNSVLHVIPPTCKRDTPYNPADRAFPTVRCKCGAEVHGENWDESCSSAIAAWNRRAPSRDADLQAENDRLRTALAENITSATMLRGMNVIDGGLNIGLEGGAAQLLAESFAEQFVESGAINYLELVFTHDRIGKLVVTLQKAGALTPGDKTRAAEARVAELEAAIAAAEGSE